MPFNSLNFGIFFLIFYAGYLGLARWHRLQNLWLLAASYTFYAFWDVRFLLILVGLTGANYLLGLGLSGRTPGSQSAPFARRFLLAAGLLINLGTLVLFKYLDFFSPRLIRLLGEIGLPAESLLVNLVMPLGISFYTLQASSYLLDVSARRLQPTKNILDLALFIGFFPQLMAGPIERAGRMLPQFSQPRPITPASVSAGIYLLMSGFFKKLVVADNLAPIVNQIFTRDATLGGVTVLLGVLAFTVQLYADFSAYSDIARGLARLLGIELMVNFRLPYFAASPGEFWQRWHISLSEWLRDYIFFPLRKSLLRWKSRSGKLAGLVLPPLVTMLVSGIWHGTGWNFILWGLYHGAWMIAWQVVFHERPAQSAIAPGSAEGKGTTAIWGWVHRAVRTSIQVLGVFLIVSLGWLIFRVESLGQIPGMFSRLFQASPPESLEMWGNVLLYSLPLLLVQIIQQARGDLLALARLPVGLRVLLYGIALALMVALGSREVQEFIYVQF